MRHGSQLLHLISTLAVSLVLLVSCSKTKNSPVVTPFTPTPDTPIAPLHRAVQYSAEISGTWHWQHTFTSWTQAGSSHTSHNPDSTFAVTFVGDTVVSVYGDTMLYDPPSSEYWAYSDNVTFSVTGSDPHRYTALLYDTTTKSMNLIRERSALGGGYSDEWIGIK